MPVIDALWKSFWPLWVLFVVLDVAVLVVLAFVLRKAFEVRPRFHRRRPSPQRVLTLLQTSLRERWQVINRKFKSGSPDSSRIAIIDADALVDDVLKRMGLRGEHMSDRLGRLSPGDLPSLDRVWRAHRLRNDLVHSPHTSVPPDIAEAAMRDYEAFLKDIGVLE